MGMTNQNEENAVALADWFWERLLELQPTLATAIGDERYDDQLEDPSEEGAAEMQAFFADAAQRLAGIDRSQLGTDLRSVMNIIDFSAK